MSKLDLDEDLAIAAQEMRRSAAAFRDNPPAGETPEFLAALIAGNEHIASVMERARADLATLKAENAELERVCSVHVGLASRSVHELVDVRRERDEAVALLREARRNVSYAPLMDRIDAFLSAHPAPSAESEAT